MDTVSISSATKLYLKKHLSNNPAKFVRLKSDLDGRIKLNIAGTEQYELYAEVLIGGQPVKLKQLLDDVEIIPRVTGQTLVVDVFATTSEYVDIDTVAEKVDTPSNNVPKKLSMTTTETSIDFGTQVKGFYLFWVTADCYMDFDRSIDDDSPLVKAGSSGYLEYKCTKLHGKTSSGTSTAYLVGVY